MNKNYTYIIIPSTDLDYINFNQTIESKNSLRYNVEKTEFIIKFKGVMPLYLKEYKKYSHSEILELTRNPGNGWIKIEI
jgi:hypothetical protein